MPKYLFEASYTAEGLKGLLKDGGLKRRKDLQEAVKELGGTLEAIYFAFGDEDVYRIVDMVLNKNVDIVSYGNDRYGRTLGVVYADGKNVNLEMVKAGLAEVYRGKPAPGFENDPYQKAADAARSAGIGMWSLGDKYISPKDWRKYH